jgi:chorismate-pyruvate lyase
VNTRPAIIPDLHSLVTLFSPTLESVGTFQEVSADQLPPYYRRLLDHHDHMTVTQEAVHQCRVAVEVRKRRLSRRHYERQSLLRATRGGRVLQYCVVRLRFAYLDESVREDIENEQVPLGRILIHHKILRRVQRFALWKIMMGPELCHAFGLETPTVTYGRTALIYCNDEPAVELLEIIAPPGELDA